MIRLSKRLIPSLIVNPDDSVIAVYLDTLARNCVIALAEAHLDAVTTLKGVRLEISAWSDVSISVDQEGNSVYIERLPDEPSDICEFRQEANEIFLAGFLRETRGWYTLIFRDPCVSIEYVAEEKRIPQALP